MDFLGSCHSTLVLRNSLRHLKLTSSSDRSNSFAAVVESRHQSYVDMISRQTKALDALCERVERDRETENRLAQLMSHFHTSDTEASKPNITRERSIIRAAERVGARDHTPLSTKRIKCCSKACKCACHRRTWISLPRIAFRWTGQLSVRYSNLSWLQPRCNIGTCSRMSSSSVSIHYTLPFWLANRMFIAWYTCAPLFGPELQLKTARVFQSDAYYHARVGDLETLRAMYHAGEASIHDVDPFEGLNTLTVGSCIMLTPDRSD